MRTTKRRSSSARRVSQNASARVNSCRGNLSGTAHPDPRPVLEASRVPMHRLRLVQRPYTPYLQWELQFLRVRDEAGERIRVLDAGTLDGGRDLCRLPELVILRSSVMYEVLYDDSGTLSGARKILDTDVIESAARSRSSFLAARTSRPFSAGIRLWCLLSREPSARGHDSGTWWWRRYGDETRAAGRGSTARHTADDGPEGRSGSAAVGQEHRPGRAALE
ncbi:DUF6879 family protein [Streptosporangium canum]|uniref:DUF6879 family protein n=1 Tax=Streptosporangium canum TaxID=324952 RepID=UPI0037994B10